jgi:hypothetical protein
MQIGGPWSFCVAIHIAVSPYFCFDHAVQFVFQTRKNRLSIKPFGIVGDRLLPLSAQLRKVMLWLVGLMCSVAGNFAAINQMFFLFA